jgi:hypothetical protein
MSERYDCQHESERYQRVTGAQADETSAIASSLSLLILTAPD